MIGVSSEKKDEDRKNLKRKPANVVMKYMQDFGYKVYPINPFAKGEVINGEKVHGSLEEFDDIIGNGRWDSAQDNIEKSPFTVQVGWIDSFNIEYFLGVDGLSIPMVLLTALLSFLCIIASWNTSKKILGYFYSINSISSSLII